MKNYINLCANGVSIEREYARYTMWRTLVKTNQKMHSMTATITI